MNTEINLYPKITVVTPNYNQGNFLERTIISVLDQGYKELEYIIIDGGSTDTSVEIIKKYNHKLHCWESNKDKGMYYAINKGFSKSTGEIMCWINSDDVLWKGALQFVADVFSKHKEVNWLQGFPSVIDEEDKLLFQREPVATKDHFYNLRFNKDFSFIQQESTFWRRSLWHKTGGKLDTTYNLAADFDLWLRFFKYEDLYCTKKQLAAFRKRNGQKSSDKKRYLEEANKSLIQHYKSESFFNKLRWNFDKYIRNDRLSIKWIEDL